MRTFFKDPGDATDWIFDWSAWLDAGETISTSSFVADTGITVGTGSNGTPAPSHNTTTATVWLSGGTDGKKYDVKNTITTSGGRTVQRGITVAVTYR